VNDEALWQVAANNIGFVSVTYWYAIVIAVVLPALICLSVCCWQRSKKRQIQRMLEAWTRYQELEEKRLASLYAARSISDSKFIKMSTFQAIIDENNMLRRLQGMQPLACPSNVHALISMNDAEQEIPISDRDMLFLIDFIDKIEEENEKLKFENQINEVGITFEDEEKFNDRSFILGDTSSSMDYERQSTRRPKLMRSTFDYDFEFNDVYISQSFHTGSNSSASPTRNYSASSIRDDDVDDDDDSE
jgi:hypothetical protein